MKYGTTKWCYKCGGVKMQVGGSKRQVTPEEYQASLQQGYKQISPNTAVKNTQQNQLKAASATRMQAGQMTAQEKAKYDNWVNQQISSGTSPLKLYELGYISKEQADKLQLSYKPASDTIYFNKSNIPTTTRPAGTYAPYGDFNYDLGNIKGMMKNDTLFFQPNVPQNLRDRAQFIYEQTEGVKPVTITKGHFSPGVAKLQMGGKTSWPNTLGFGKIIEKRNLDQLPFFRMGGLKHFQPGGTTFNPMYSEVQNENIPLPQEEIDRQRRILQHKTEWERMNPRMIYENRNGTGEAITPNIDPNYKTQTSFDNSTLSLRANGRKFDDNTNLIPNKPNYMGIGNAINYGVAGLAEYAGIYDRNAQQGYMNRMLYNPLSGILPFDDGRSKNIKEGYNMMKGGGLFANYWAKKRRGEAAGTRKPNKSSASKEEWERSAKTSKK